MARPSRRSIRIWGTSKTMGTSFDSKIWFSLDPTGILGMTVSYFVHILAVYTLATRVIIPGDLWSNSTFWLLHLPFTLLAILSLYKASTTDPGAVPLGARPFTTFRRAGSSNVSSNSVSNNSNHISDNSINSNNTNSVTSTTPVMISTSSFTPQTTVAKSTTITGTVSCSVQTNGITSTKSGALQGSTLASTGTTADVKQFNPYVTKSSTNVTPTVPPFSRTNITVNLAGSNTSFGDSSETQHSHHPQQYESVPTSLTTPPQAAATTAPQVPPQAPPRCCHKCCDNYKPIRAHHDSVTGRCIVKFDHFCPWVNNAIGLLNHKFFCLFLLYTAMACLTSLALLTMRLSVCGFLKSTQNGETSVFDNHDNTLSGKNENYHPSEANDRQVSITDAATATGNGTHRFLLRSSLHDQRTKNDTNYYMVTDVFTLLIRSLLSSQEDLDDEQKSECQRFLSSKLVLALVLASFLFLIFTAAMSCEQFEAIKTGKNKIARMQQLQHNNNQQQRNNSVNNGIASEFQRVTEEFNEMFGGTTASVSWHWFLPTDVVFPRGMKKLVLGYDYDDNNHHHLPHSMNGNSMTLPTTINSSNNINGNSNIDPPSMMVLSNTQSSTGSSSSYFHHQGTNTMSLTGKLSTIGTITNRKASRPNSEDNISSSSSVSNSGGIAMVEYRPGMSQLATTSTNNTTTCTITTSTVSGAAGINNHNANLARQTLPKLV